MTEFFVDFNDPASIANGIPHAKTRIQQAEKRLSSARERAQKEMERASDAELEMQRWRAVLLTLEQLTAGAHAETTPATPDSAQEGSSKDRALRVLIAINGPASIADVAEHMTELSPKTVSWALWKLADEGVIQRLGHGRYAPPGYVPDQPTTNYLKLPPPLPRPSQAQISQAVDEAVASARQRIAERD